jgi:5-formyltetrahydrofolate cyclo-ligase
VSVSPEPGVAKAALRSGLLAHRRSLDPAARAEHAARLQSTLIAHLPDLLKPAGGRAATVAGYVPVGPEPGGADLPEVLRRALAPRARLLLPVLRDDLDLDWAVYTGMLVPATRGLREPPGARLGVSAVATAGLLVVPAVAVDRRGVRLGRGSGSFDRALARVAQGARVVALLYDGELLDEVPAEPHDRRVSAVITPAAGLVTFS